MRLMCLDVGDKNIGMAVSAEKVLLKTNVNRKKRKGLLDKISATVILQNYLDSVRQ